jgi:hypothetical protein
MVDVGRLYVGRRKLAQDWANVPLQHTRDDLRVLVAGLDVSRQPDVRESIHGRRLERQRLVGLFGRSDVDTSINLRPVLPGKLACLLQRQVRITPQNLLLAAPVHAEAKHP